MSGLAGIKANRKKFLNNLNYKTATAAHQRSFLLFERISEFSVPSIILADLLGKRCSLERVKKVMVCDWWISIRFVCFCVSLGSLLNFALNHNSNFLFHYLAVRTSSVHKRTQET